MEDKAGAGWTLITLLVPASVYRRPQTAAAPTLSSPCSEHKSTNAEETQFIVRLHLAQGDILYSVLG